MNAKIICIAFVLVAVMESVICQQPQQMAQAGMDQMTGAMGSVPMPGAQQAADVMKKGFQIASKFAKEGQQTAEKALEMGKSMSI